MRLGVELRGICRLYVAGAMSRTRVLQGVMLTAMGLCIIGVFLGPIHRTFLHLPVDQNEGWNAYHALVALSGGTLYPPADSFISTNYPPLSFFVVGYAGKLIGDNIIAGRLIALASLLAVAVNVYRLTFLLGAERFFAAFSSLLFLLLIGTYAPEYRVMNDPEWLGHAFTTSGAVFFLRARERPRAFGYLLLSSLLCVGGVMVKQNLIVLPLALFLWSIFDDRRLLKSWTLLCLVIGSSMLVLTIARYGAVFLQDVFLHQRVMSVHRLELNAMRYVMPLTPLVIYAALLGAAAIREWQTRWALTYVLIAGALGLFFLSGELVGVNIVFDLIIALSIAAGLFGTRLASVSTVSYRQWTPAAALVMASVCLPPLLQALQNSVDIVRKDHGQKQAYGELIGEIAASKGPVACEMTSLCYWAGKPFELDGYNYLQKIKKGKVDAARLKQLIDERYFTYLLPSTAPGRPATANMLGVELSRDVDENYREVRQVEDQLLLAPRP